MSKGLFITATGTDAGKTYITALIVKKLHEAGLSAGYYKAALSGSASTADSDAGYVCRISGISQPEDTLLSYRYETPVSPHLAAKLEGCNVELSQVVSDYQRVCELCDYVTVEGSGGIVCPIRWDEKQHILLEDVIHTLGLDAIIIADAGLGTINAVVTTAYYMKNHGIEARGVILNNYTGGTMQEDNVRMIEALTGLPVLDRVAPGQTELQIDAAALAELYR